MKKLLILLISVILVLCSACSGSSPPPDDSLSPQSSSTSVSPIPDNTPSPTESPEPENLYPGELLYKGVPVSSFLGASIDDALSAMGKQFEEDNWVKERLLYTLEGLYISFDESTRDVLSVELSPSACEIDGVGLVTNRAGLMDILGSPNHEWEVDPDGYIMNYDHSFYRISFAMDTPADDVHTIYVGFDLGQWIEVEHISIAIPSSWSYDYVGPGRYVSFDIDCGNENISMGVFELGDTTDNVRSNTFGGAFSLDRFTFNNGTDGYYAYDDTQALFTYGDGEAHYIVDYSANPEWYKEYSPLIRAIVKTLSLNYTTPDWNDGGSGSDSNQSGDMVSADGYIISAGTTVYVRGGGWSLLGSAIEGKVNVKADGSWSISWVAVLENMGLSGWQRSEIHSGGWNLMYYSPTTGREMGVTPPENVSANQLYVELGNIS